ncbi:MAG: cyclopropane-fatty-acyl-phospholipid synthase [Thermoleophilaceae bacterium]|jgi:cyclopropane-fatty-acyl-phospholipid synthase|nr:cyclopropane-fatty-acyl-phospholipid synthase [Thermoleophilaceae bacterium]
MPLARPAALRRELERSFPERPFAVTFWDGSELAPTGGGQDIPRFVVRDPRAIAHVLMAPGELGLGRAYVSGTLDVEPLDAVMPLLDNWEPPPLPAGTRARLALAAVRAAGVTRPPRAPSAELRLRGPLHTRDRDARAVRHHYDLPPEFFALFLDASMTYSCAVFSRGAETLEEAQRTKLEMVCTKLALKPRERVLDIGCGWGSFAIHAAREHGARVTGITLSEPQAQLARARAKEADVHDRVDIRVMDYRALEPGERYDAVASIGMVEHVGEQRIDEYAREVAALLEPGGRLLNHGIALLREGDAGAGPFSERYVFPDAKPLQLSRVQLALERAGFVTRLVEGFADDYAETLRQWARRLDDNTARARELAGDERLRVWRLYLRAARNGFETGFTSIYQVLATRA